MSSRPVRVRFAPSPTGPLHIGGMRTALYNYLFAKHFEGTFILRIEDTDQVRYVPGAEEYIMEALRWCGLTYTEGPDAGGPHAPYQQSERKAIYRQYADQLLNAGWAYYAFDKPEDLDALRKDYESKGQTFSYNAVERKRMKNSISLPASEVEKLLAQNEPHVIRFKMPEAEDVHMKDIIRGEISVNTSTLDDKVLFKADGLPTYHLANVVDDYLMQISHVIRGEEWLPSLPLHVLLYRGFGWTDRMPQFAHLPLILKPSGQGKLSKRDGDKAGFPVFPLEWTDPFSKEVSSGYREQGYFKEAFLNILAMLGWNPGTEQELFELEELCQVFSLERVHKSGARFDPEKAKWYNQQYLRKQSDATLAEQFKVLLADRGINTSSERLITIIALVKERAVFAKDFWDQAWFFFETPTTYDQEIIKKRWNESMPALLNGLPELFDSLPAFTVDNIKPAIHDYAGRQNANFGNLMNCLRLVLVGSSMGPDLVTLCAMLGKVEVKKRIEKAINIIGK
ncbi:MAG: glutamate--tRNA ligase [Bacteroidales bacterium]